MGSLHWQWAASSHRLTGPFQGQAVIVVQGHPSPAHITRTGGAETVALWALLLPGTTGRPRPPPPPSTLRGAAVVTSEAGFPIGTRLLSFSAMLCSCTKNERSPAQSREATSSTRQEAAEEPGWPGQYTAGPSAPPPPGPAQDAQLGCAALPCLPEWANGLALSAGSPRPGAAAPAAGARSRPRRAGPS